MSIRIVADSSANLYKLDDADFAYVSLTINCNGQEFVDNESLDVLGMNRMLHASKHGATTSCPNVSAWLDAFEGAEQIFAITITSNLSGSYAAAMNAASQYMEEHPGSKVSVIDTLSAGPELCLIVEKIRESIDSGMSFEEIDREARAYMKKTHLLFALQALTNLAKNGRVSMAKAKIAGVLGIRVVGKASDEGTLQDLQKCRGEAKSLSAIFHLMLEHGYNGGKVIIAHCLNTDAANALKNIIIQTFQHAKITLQKTGGLCSFYAEDGGLLIGYEA